MSGAELSASVRASSEILIRSASIVLAPDMEAVFDNAEATSY